jgi:hypothetical protein
MASFWRELLRAFGQIPAMLQKFGDLPGRCREICRAICRRIALTKRGEWPQRPRRGPCCFKVPDVYKRPDPLIYAQYYLMAQGLAVTWDNPDIQLFDRGVPVPSSSLLPDHDYEVRVRVWNGSYDAPAVGVRVTLAVLTFGIATKADPVPKDDVVNLGVKGSSQQPAIATFAWRTPRQAGHFCLQAQLHWHDDANPDNNLGQENVSVGALASPAQFTFTLRNDASVRRQFALEADTYQLPAASPCDEEFRRRVGGEARAVTRLAESRARWVWARRTQAYGGFRVPDSWSVSIAPNDPVLAPGEQREIHVAIEPRDPAFRGSKTFNVHGFALGTPDRRDLAGGVTLVVTR